MPRVSELLYGIKVTGKQVKVHQIEGADIEVCEIGFFDSEFAAGACVSGECEGQKIWFLTFSQVVLETLEALKGKEPYTATFLSHESATGRTYWTIE